jgi:hypothetical protein
MVSSVLCQVVKLLALIIDIVGPVLQAQKLLLPAVHETRWNVMPVECCMKLIRRNLVVILESASVGGRLCSRIPSKLLGGIHSLLILCAVEEPKL